MEIKINYIKRVASGTRHKDINIDILYIIKINQLYFM